MRQKWRDNEGVTLHDLDILAVYGVHETAPQDIVDLIVVMIMGFLCQGDFFGRADGASQILR